MFRIHPVTPIPALWRVTGAVCPTTPTARYANTVPTGAPPFAPKPPEPKYNSVAAWAEAKLNFHPSPRQAEVLNVEAKYLMLCCNRQWGKTVTMAVKTLHAALQTPKLRILVISRSKEQAGILIENATGFAIGLGLKTTRFHGQPYSLQLPNESRICAVPHTVDSSLGRTADILVVDEAAAVSDEVYQAVAPYIARTRGKIWLLSTPSRQTGFFYEFWHDDNQRWRRIFSNVEDCPEIDRSFLAMQRAANPARYRQDFLCEFVQPDGYLTNRDFVRSILRKKESE